MRALHLDAYSGISGDMTVAVLVDLGVDFARIEEMVRTLPLRGVQVSVRRSAKDGIMATQFRVEVEDAAAQAPRYLPQIEAIIQAAPVPEEVRCAALETFRLLGEAEAEVHGKPIEKIHFHEVGAVDAIVDILSAHYGFHLLGVEYVSVSPLNVGMGTVTCEHGVLPVPAPATALLLRGVPIQSGGVEAELVTPTGAALVRQRAQHFGGVPPMRVERVGYGRGSRDLPDRPNVVRGLLGTVQQDVTGVETIAVLEANVDDMTAELLGGLVVELLEAGARDAFVTPIVGKKGRPAHIVTALVTEERKAEVARVLFRGSTTLGIRQRTEQRWVLPRAVRAVTTPWGKVRVKIAELDGSVVTRAPEYEDCKALAERHRIPLRAVYESALASALKEEFVDG
jgi:uncharacterized protein (TIGR00299 family) protein